MRPRNNRYLPLSAVPAGRFTLSKDDCDHPHGNRSLEDVSHLFGQSLWVPEKLVAGDVASWLALVLHDDVVPVAKAAQWFDEDGSQRLEFWVPAAVLCVDVPGFKPVGLDYT